MDFSSSLFFTFFSACLVPLFPAAFPAPSSAQAWDGPVRGSWVRAGAPQPGDLVLAAKGKGCEIIVGGNEHSAVRRAAFCLSRDIERISGFRPPIVTKPTGAGTAAVHLVTLGKGALPEEVRPAGLQGKWEAYRIVSLDKDLWLAGSDFRGTAFAAYTLSERLGVDPLYLWTGYRPVHHDPLVLKKADFQAGPPTFRFRGLFHDDEDILPRPFDARRYPLQTGTVSQEWYERYFETASRLRLNMVAPYVRVRRRKEVQKTASDWGFYFTSHHYDTLLSNPWGFKRFGLGKERGSGEKWDWFANKEGMLRYWKGGVLENRDLDCIWPVGMRGTADRGYSFPPGTAQAEKDRIFEEVIRSQVNMVKSLLPPGKVPLFHFTLYGEMLDNYLKGRIHLPPEVILVWDDNGDGVMRALPIGKGPRRNGVYYHLAFLGRRTKQSAHIVTPMRIEAEFRRIVRAGATEFMLLNVSELREFVMGARMIAEICWDAKTAFGKPDAAGRYLSWWCREYFGTKAAPEAEAVYRDYYRLLDRPDRLHYGASKVHGALSSLVKKFTGRPFAPAMPSTLPTLRERESGYEEALAKARKAMEAMGPPEKQFFFENAMLWMLFDYRPTQAAVLLVRAMSEPDRARAWEMCRSAMPPLEKLEIEILRAQRPPFRFWYAETWIRSHGSVRNLHRPYQELRAFLSTGGRRFR